MTKFQLKQLTNLQKEENEVRNYVLSNLHKKKTNNVRILLTSAIFSTVAILFVSIYIFSNVNEPDQLISGAPIISTTQAEQLKELTNSWALALKSRDGKPRYDMMNEQAKKKFEQVQIQVHGEDWHFVIGDSSPWVKSYSFELNELQATIRYTLTDSTGTMYQTSETIYFEKQANGSFLVTDYTE